MKKAVLKSDKYTVIATAIAFLISLLVCVSIFLPRNIGCVLSVTDKPEAKFDLTQIRAQYDCFVESDGKYNIIGNDPQIIFALDGQPIEALKIEVDAPKNETVALEVFTAFEDGAFSSERCYADQVFDGKESAVIDLPKGEYYSVRIDINTDGIYFEGLELYSQNPQYLPFAPSFTVGDYLKGIGIPFIIAAIIWLVDSRTRFAKKAFDAIKKNKFKILEFLIFSVVAVLAGVLAELLIGLFVGGGAVNPYRAVFLCGIAEIIFVFIYFRKDMAAKPERLFLPLILTLGAVMLFGSPVRHIAWDIDSHYPWAVDMSYIDEAYYSTSDREIDVNGAGELVGPFTDLDQEKYNERITKLNEMDKVIASKKQANFSLAHLPAGIFIAIARFFGASFEFKYNFGRLSYLLVYSFTCYFAVKKLKSGKMILAVICLFPTNLYLATNYAYDWCVTAFTILGTAYFVSELQQPDKPITVKDTVIMGLAFVVGAWSKLVYIILMGMTLFIRKNWQSKKDKRRYYIVIISIFAALFAYFMVTTLVKMGGEGDTRGGDVNPTAQMMGILANPFDYVKLLFKFLSQYLAFGTMKEYISHFAYLGIGKYWIIIAVLLIVVALTDANRDVSFKIPLYMKGLSVLLFVGMAALIATALYINFTPLDADIIRGCQPRYITPLLPPLLLLITGQRFNIIKNKSVYNGVVLAVSTLVVLLEIYSMIIIRMI